jgi:uncharacterized protein YbjT (DUF2867 family)
MLNNKELKIAILGSSGLVGSQLLAYCLDDKQIASVTSYVRKSSGISHTKLVEIVIVFENLELEISNINVDVVFCCLGTTIKNAGSKEKFKKIDFTFPLQMAKICKKFNINKFIVITALGANPYSPIFYNKTKGELEQQLVRLQLEQLCIVRPSLLLGNRIETRPMEKLFSIISPIINIFMLGPLKKYKAIDSFKVAYSMLWLAKKKTDTNYIIESDTIASIYNDDHSK